MENNTQKYKLRQKAHKDPSYYARLVDKKVNQETQVKPANEIINLDDEEDRAHPKTATKDKPIIIDD